MTKRIKREKERERERERERMGVHDMRGLGPYCEQVPGVGSRLRVLNEALCNEVVELGRPLLLLLQRRGRVVAGSNDEEGLPSCQQGLRRRGSEGEGVRTRIGTMSK